MQLHAIKEEQITFRKRQLVPFKTVLSRSCTGVILMYEHDKAQKKSWSSSASGLSSRCPVLPLDPARSGWDSEVDSARLSLTIIQFTAHVILISNTHSQQAHICKSYKSPVAMGERRSSRWGNTGSCSCGPAHRRLGSIWSLSLRAKQYGEFGSRTERLSRPF